MPTQSSRPQVAPESRACTLVVRTLAVVAVVIVLFPAAAWPQRKVPGGAVPKPDAALLRNAPETPSPQTPTPTPTPTPTAEQLFDGSQLQVIRLTMKPADWQTLMDDFGANTYYVTDLEWKDQKVMTAGVRSRGSGSRNQNKPALRIDFDRYMQDQRFLGLKSVVLVNAVQDTSMLRHRLAYTFFAKMSIPASRAVHAQVYVNGDYIGLYQLVESVDKVMLPRVFGGSSNKEDDGYLYEYRWTDVYQWTYLGSDLQPYADRFEPHTHESEAPADLYGRIEEMIRAINTASDGDFESRAGEYFDLTRLAAFLAVESFLAEADGFLGDWGINNFYLYQFENQQRWAFLPWDKDLAFFDSQFDIFRHVDDNVLASRLLTLSSARKTYLDTLQSCAALAMSPDTSDPTLGWLEAEVKREAAQIKAAAYSDRHKPYPDSDFDNAIVWMIAFAKERGPFVSSQVARARMAATLGRR
jgi:hypothetical protein